jgi:FKBP-type peptidyl-prolyl cis-trans isomerase
VQYKDARAGAGDKIAERGDRVVYTWEGYTIGYFGRPFQRNNGPQGGAFENEEGNNRFVLGRGEVIPALDDAMIGMKEGGVRQVIIPPGPLSYPENDPDHVMGPTPTTFSGMRALNFVLYNKGGQMDKTLLINVKLLRVDKPGERGFKG